MGKKASPSAEAEADHHEQAALEHVGASSELAMGSPKRLQIEKRLKLKLDARMSILVSIVLRLRDSEAPELMTMPRCESRSESSPKRI